MNISIFPRPLWYKNIRDFNLQAIFKIGLPKVLKMIKISRINEDHLYF